MALLDKSAGQMFSQFRKTKERYDAQHERVMDYLAKHGYEKVMHKNLSKAPVVVPTVNEIVERVERPVLPVRGRMNAPRRAEVPAAAAAPGRRVRIDTEMGEAEMKKNIVDRLMNERKISRRAANRLFKEGVVPVGKQMAHSGAQTETVEKKEMATTTEKPKRVYVKKPVITEPKPGAFKGEMKDESSVNRNLLSLMWKEIKANPGMSKKDAMAIVKKKD